MEGVRNTIFFQIYAGIKTYINSLALCSVTLCYADYSENPESSQYTKRSSL